MGDLISRGVLLKEIEKTARSVEEARSEEDIKKTFLQCLSVVREEVNRMKPAYDIGKVIEKLEEYLESERHFKDIIDADDIADEIKNPVITRTFGRIEALEKAIEIVKRGGM